MGAYIIGRNVLVPWGRQVVRYAQICVYYGDPTPEALGRLLLERYATHEAVEALISLGHLQRVGFKLAPQDDIDDPDYTVAQCRDVRGGRGVPLMGIADELEELMPKAWNEHIQWVYLWTAPAGWWAGERTSVVQAMNDRLHPLDAVDPLKPLIEYRLRVRESA